MCVMYHAACKVEFQLFNRSYSQLTFSNFLPEYKISIVHTAARGGTCAFTLHLKVENSQHADQKQFTWQSSFDVDIESTHRQPASCRARPVNVDDDPEYIRWIRVLGGEKLPAASYSPLLNLKKDTSTWIVFAIVEGSSIFVACFLHSSAQMCLHPTPARRPPLITSRFVNTAVTTDQISWRIRWFCRSSVEDSESRRFELTFWWSFLRAILAQHLPRNYLFGFF